MRERERERQFVRVGKIEERRNEESRDKKRKKKIMNKDCGGREKKEKGKKEEDKYGENMWRKKFCTWVSRLCSGMEKNLIKLYWFGSPIIIK